MAKKNVVAESSKRYMKKPDKFLSGIAPLDLMFTSGGWPTGKWYQFLGKQSSGKSTALMQIAGEQLRAGKSVLWFDTEAVFDPEYALAFGITTDEKEEGYAFHDLFELYQPENLEELGDKFVDFLDTVTDGIIIVDSVAFGTTRKEMEKTFDDNAKTAVAATFWTRLINLTVVKVLKTRNTVFLINQLRDNLAPMAMEADKPFGPRAIQHVSSLNLLFKVIKREKDGEVVHVIVQSWQKNKLNGRVNYSVPMRITLGQGFAYKDNVLEYAIGQKVVKQEGASYSFVHPETGELQKARGRAKALVLFDFDTILQVLRKNSNTTGEVESDE